MAALGRAYTKLTIREQRTRWGSCSTSRAMSFNWRLLLGPEEVLDYVIWHEACHLVVMDHSRRFWTLLERHRPGYRAAQRWLRANGTALVLPRTVSGPSASEVAHDREHPLDVGLRGAEVRDAGPRAKRPSTVAFDR